METKHTPGPWHAHRMRLGPRAKDRRCGFVVNGPDAEPLPTRVCDLRVPAGVDGFAEGQANARLIAASPELLQSLTAIVDRIMDHHGGDADFLPVDSDWDPENFAAIQDARAAIAKATRGE